MGTYIRLFSEIGAGDVGVAGGKGANLGEMTRAGLPVPPGFVLAADAYREFIRSTASDAAISRILGDHVHDDPAALERASDEIRAALLGEQMPHDIASDVLDAYHALAAQMGAASAASLPVAVRSSATAEDLPTASFAGQQDTYLNIRGDEALLEHAKRCWASLWTARAIAYRVQQGFDHDQVALAVVVQAMIQSEVSGVLFTANPVSGNRDETVINASWGLGEAIVSGLVTPDTYIVRKSDGAIVDRDVADKDRMIEYAESGGTVELAVHDEERIAPALADEQIRGLAALGQRIEAHYRAPMDVEWAFAREQFYILQARAITTLGGGEGAKTLQNPSGLSRDDPGEYNRSMFVEIFPDALSPAFLSVIDPLLKCMLDFNFQTLGFQSKEQEAIKVVYNQPYFRRDYIESAFRNLSPAVREELLSLIVNPFGHISGGLKTEFSPAFLGMVARLARFMLVFPNQLPGLIARYRSEIEAVAALDPNAMPEKEIIARIRKLVYETGSDLLSYDFLMIALLGLTYQTLGGLLTRYLGDETEQVRAKLLSGVTGNVTMETNQRIWDLAELAKKLPAVSDALRRYTGEELMAQLKATREGEEFLAALDRFLEQYGHREVRLDILYPTWIEDPSPVLAFVRGYLDVGEEKSPYRLQEQLVDQRRETQRTVERRLSRDPAGRFVVAPIFRWVLAQSLRHTRERDTMHFELTRLFPPFRCLLLELGQRWAARGVIAQPDDIFFLTLEEMGETADTSTPVQEIVAKRRAELEESKRHGAPPVLRGGEEIGLRTTPVTAPADGELRGIAGSPGRVSGAARVIHGPDEFGRLQKGDILVAPLTNPVWTPLFAIAGGIVTEVGGILSHGAIVAREYGIPAVMAVPGATRILSDGARLTIDGTQGTVKVEGA